MIGSVGGATGGVMGGSVGGATGGVMGGSDGAGVSRATGKSVSGALLGSCGVIQQILSLKQDDPDGGSASTFSSVQLSVQRSLITNSVMVVDSPGVRVAASKESSNETVSPSRVWSIRVMSISLVPTLEISYSQQISVLQSSGFSGCSTSEQSTPSAVVHEVSTYTRQLLP